MGDQVAEKTVLILGGTREAAGLAALLTEAGGFRIISSLAGRTRAPGSLAGETRIGGFGGAKGLAQYIADLPIDAVVDATHPFATRMSRNAEEAAHLSGVPRVVLLRDGWSAGPGDDWREVKDERDAAELLPAGATVFLALGSQHLAAFRERTDLSFIVRMIDPPEQGAMRDNWEVILGRPGTSAAAEQALFSGKGITHLVCRNSGGSASFAKLEAARKMRLPVFMIARPGKPQPPLCGTAAEVLEFLQALA